MSPFPKKAICSCAVFFFLHGVKAGLVFSSFHCGECTEPTGIMLISSHSLTTNREAAEKPDPGHLRCYKTKQKNGALLKEICQRINIVMLKVSPHDFCDNEDGVLDPLRSTLGSLVLGFTGGEHESIRVV